MTGEVAFELAPNAQARATAPKESGWVRIAPGLWVPEVNGLVDTDQIADKEAPDGNRRMELKFHLRRLEVLGDGGGDLNGSTAAFKLLSKGRDHVERTLEAARGHTESTLEPDRMSPRLGRLPSLSWSTVQQSSPWLQRSENRSRNSSLANFAKYLQSDHSEDEVSTGDVRLARLRHLLEASVRPLPIKVSCRLTGMGLTLVLKQVGQLDAVLFGEVSQQALRLTIDWPRDDQRRRNLQANARRQVHQIARLVDRAWAGAGPPLHIRMIQSGLPEKLTSALTVEPEGWGLPLQAFGRNLDQVPGLRFEQGWEA